MSFGAGEQLEGRSLTSELQEPRFSHNLDSLRHASRSAVHCFAVTIMNSF